MNSESILPGAEKKMEKALEVLGEELKGLRTGRANPGLVENLKVEYYGTPTPLKQLATISVPEAQVIVIKPYDPVALKEIEKAFLQSDLGFNPQSDGKVIRINLPSLTEERRKKLASQVKEMSEETKIAIRNVRRDVNKRIDKEEKEGLLSEDDADKTRKEVQDLTRDYEKKVDDLVTKKTQEIMKI